MDDIRYGDHRCPACMVQRQNLLEPCWWCARLEESAKAEELKKLPKLVEQSPRWRPSDKE